MITEKILLEASQANINALIDLDKQGFIIGPNDNIPIFIKRIQQILFSLKELKEQLYQKKQCSICDKKEEKKEGREVFSFKLDDHIPENIYTEAFQITTSLYGFQIDWVLGFFQNCGLLFGGGTYYFPNKNITLFIINKEFKKRKKWLLYTRQELLAHELCHIARMGFSQEYIYEEHFAYQTTINNSFRQNWGGIIYSDKDVYLSLFFLLLMLILQFINIFFYSLNISVVLMPLLFIIWLIIRHLKNSKKLKKAQKILKLHSCRNTNAVLFRLSDKEITTLAKWNLQMTNNEFMQLFATLLEQDKNFRFSIITKRFF